MCGRKGLILWKGPSEDGKEKKQKESLANDCSQQVTSLLILLLCVLKHGLARWDLKQGFGREARGSVLPPPVNLRSHWKPRMVLPLHSAPRTGCAGRKKKGSAWAGEEVAEAAGEDEDGGTTSRGKQRWEQGRSGASGPQGLSQALLWLTGRFPLIWVEYNNEWWHTLFIW